MIITCEQCQARFRLADEKLKPGGTKVRCSKCKQVFTVLPPEPAPGEEAVDYGDFNMEPVSDEATPPPESAPAPPAFAAEPPPASPGGEVDLDFSGLEQSMGPGAAGEDIAEDFSFADTSAPAEPAETGPPVQPPSQAGDGEPNLAGGGGPPDELDFDSTFAEIAEFPGAAVPADETVGFMSGDEPPGGETATEPVDSSTFDFAPEPAAPATEEFTLDTESPASGMSEFGFETEAGATNPVFDEEPAATEKAESFEFGTGDSFESSALDKEPAATETGAAAWDQPEKLAGPSFDFDEPSFESTTGEKTPKSSDTEGLSFGEIDFTDEEAAATPSFGAEPDFSQATLERPAEPETPPPPPPPRPQASRPRSEEPLPTPSMARKSPVSSVLLILALLLLILCGAGGYFYFMGGGQLVIERLLLKVKGEEPAGPVEQRIGLAIDGSSYVDSRESGQLLIIQGSATNNFAAARSAITVKGLLLDAGGKVLQQQTVFCGNSLSEEKLRTMKYAQIEEAMNNQFGDSLANMNVKPGVAINFTIVFRNLPKDLANINVEVVDSKPGGL